MQAMCVTKRYEIAPMHDLHYCSKVQGSSYIALFFLYLQVPWNPPPQPPPPGISLMHHTHLQVVQDGEGLQVLCLRIAVLQVKILEPL